MPTLCRVSTKYMDLHPLHWTLYTIWDFSFLSKDDFKVGKQVLSFLVLKMIWISNNFFNLLVKFWVMFPLYWTKTSVKALSCWDFYFFWEIVQLFSGFCCSISLSDYFIQRLIINIGGPLNLILIFRPDLTIFLTSYNKVLPVTACNTNPMHNPLIIVWEQF